MWRRVFEAIDELRRGQQPYLPDWRVVRPEQWSTTLLSSIAQLDLAANRSYWLAISRKPLQISGALASDATKMPFSPQANSSADVGGSLTLTGTALGVRLR